MTTEGDRWHIEVDRGLCIGSAFCVGSAPGGFLLETESRVARPVAAETDAGEAVLAAAEGCPVEAITITVVGGGEVVFPPEE